MATNSTKQTVQGTLNFSSAFILNRPTTNVSGSFQEPAITLANLLLATILGPPFGWQWNRNTISQLLTLGQTDYIIALADFGYLEKATVTFAGDDPPTVEIQISPLLAVDGNTGRPFEISVVNDDNAGNITFRLIPAPSKAYTLQLTYQKAPPVITSLFGADAGDITSIAAAAGFSTTYTASGGISNSAALVGTYLFVSGATSSANNGLYLCTASSSTTVTLQNQKGVLQAGAGGSVYPATTWAPIPDKYNFLYERGMLAHLRGMYDMASYEQELQLFFRQLVGCSEGLDDTAKAIFLLDRLDQLRTQAYVQNSTTSSIKRG